MNPLNLERFASQIARAAYEPTTAWLTAEILEQTGLRLLQLAGDGANELGVDRDEAKRFAMLLVSAAEHVDRLANPGRPRLQQH